MRLFPNLSLLLVATGVLAAPAQAGELATYRALYGLEPQRVDSNSAQVPLDGAIAYEVRGSDCQGYALDSRFATRYVDGEHGAKTVDLRSTTFESADGLDFEVSQKQTLNNAAGDDERISVKRANVGQQGKGQLTGSKQKSFQLDANSLFPTVYEKKLLTAAMQGQSRDDSVIFDGSDGDKLYRAITFIGKKRDAGTYQPDLQNPAAKGLAGLASWGFSIGYYSLDGKSDAPDFQASFNMYENGITTEMVFDYGSYALKGKLQKLEMLASAPCDGSNINPLPPDSSAAGTPQ